MEQYLRAFTADRPSKWTNFLPWAELALNCFHHEGLGTSPFRALYGCDPPPLVAAQPSAARHDPAVTEIIEQRGALLVELRKNLQRAQQRMREAANRHRLDVQFAVGDKVLLKLQQYRQHYVAKPLSAKLARRFYEPFVVLEKIGLVAYRLQLPQGARIHDVFHVSLLCPFVEGAESQVAAELPEDFVEGRPVVQPVRILDRRIALQQGRPLEQVLVEWPERSPVGVSWEPAKWIRHKFPTILEGKDLLIGKGVDTSTTPTIATEEEPAEAELVQEEEVGE